MTSSSVADAEAAPLTTGAQEEEDGRSFTLGQVDKRSLAAPGASSLKPVEEPQAPLTNPELRLTDPKPSFNPLLASVVVPVTAVFHK